jgi:hypothetical protein
VVLNDVALLQLQSPAPGTVRPASGSTAKLGDPGRLSVVMGWGLTAGQIPESASPLLQQARMLVQRPEVCSSRTQGFDAPSMLCVYSGSSSDCMGDSGGPLLSSYGGRRYLIGLVSTGDARCSVAVPSIYSKISSGPLASFVASQVPQLEQQGEAAAPQATVPVATAPAATVPLPRLSLSKAIASSKLYGRLAYHWTSVTARCSRQTSLRFACRIYGRRLGRWWMVRRELALAVGGIVVT